MIDGLFYWAIPAAGSGDDGGFWVSGRGPRLSSRGAAVFLSVTREPGLQCRPRLRFATARRGYQGVLTAWRSPVCLRHNVSSVEAGR